MSTVTVPSTSTSTSTSTSDRSIRSEQPARSRPSTRNRLAWLAWSVSLLAVIVLEVVRQDLPVWSVVGFAILPDLAFLVGIGAPTTQPDQLAPRAVPVYNLVHRPWLPLALITAAASGIIPLVFFAGGLAWLLHIAVDHVSGYGLRTADGWQRG